MTALALRSIGKSDYAVIEDSHPVGLIRLAAERHGEVRMWNCAVPGARHGTSRSLANAKHSRNRGSNSKLKLVQSGSPSN